jgi:hypothetical protein
MLRITLIGSFLLLVAARAACAAESGGAIAELDKEYGFRGLHFGDVVDDVKGLKKAGERGECEVAYKRSSDKLEFNGVPLSGIEYSFQNDRLTVVSLLAKDGDCHKLFSSMLKLYGPDSTKLGEAGADKKFWTATWSAERVKLDISGPDGCTVTITAPEEAILEERRCREDDRLKAGAGH